MKKYDIGNYFFIIAGVLVLALAGAVAASAYGHVAILGVLVGAVGIAAIIIGLTTAGVLGAVVGIIIIVIITKLIEVFAIPTAVVLGLVGIGIIIFGIKTD